MPSAIPRNTFMRKGCEGLLSISEKSKENHKESFIPPQKKQKPPCPKQENGCGSALQQAEGVRLAGLSLFAEKPTLGRKGADGASNLFHTTP